MSCVICVCGTSFSIMLGDKRMIRIIQKHINKLSGSVTIESIRNIIIQCIKEVADFDNTVSKNLSGVLIT